MLVHIVYTPTPDRLGPDLTRMGTVEEVPDEVGRVLIGEGSARTPTDEEVAAYEEARAVEAKAEQADDLTKLTKAELLQLAEERGVTAVSETDTKATIAKAIEQASNQQTAEQSADAGIEQAV